MVKLLKRSAFGAGALFLTGALMAATSGTYGQPAANTPRTQFAQPGTVNYVEGQASLDGQPINQNSVGSAVVGAGQQLQTANGKVEILLTPGVFFRLGANSTVRMISPTLTNTTVQLVQGNAMMEVADYEKENHLQVNVAGTDATVKKDGIYEFSANPPMTRVYDGKLELAMGDHTRNLSKGDEVALETNNPKLKTQDFDLKQTETSDDLYAFSQLRADYMAQANMSAAEKYYGAGAGYGAPGWYGAGWYWNPYVDQYAFLLGDGFLWDPFGFGYFSPGYWGAYAPYVGLGYYGGGYGLYGYGHGYYRGRPGGAIVRGSALGARLGGGGFRGGVGGGFAGRPAIGGGYRGGAVGGFHGGGFGGFHGGGFGGRR
jgi:hypothetical protein